MTGALTKTEYEHRLATMPPFPAWADTAEYDNEGGVSFYSHGEHIKVADTSQPDLQQFTVAVRIDAHHFADGIVEGPYIEVVSLSARDPFAYRPDDALAITLAVERAVSALTP